MSDKVRAWVWELNLPPARKLVLLWLAGRATDNGVAFPGEREIRDRTGLGERMVRYHLQELADGEVDQPDTAHGPLLLRIERRVGAGRNTSNVYVLRVPWAEPGALRRDLQELKHIPQAALGKVLDSVGVGATGCPLVDAGDGNVVPPVGATGCPEVGATGCREESSLVNRHRNTPPSPPAGAQQQGNLTEELTTIIADLGSAESTRLTAAYDLAEAFYRGLGADTAAITPPIRKRDLAIARDLVAAGATPGEAESYARQMCAESMRIAPVDLRSFERERLGWQARCRGMERQDRRGVDRTGQPPSWQTEHAATAVAQAGEFRHAVRGSLDQPPFAAPGEQLRETLRSVLLGQTR
jgi:hypothetical protein